MWHSQNHVTARLRLSRVAHSGNPFILDVQGSCEGTYRINSGLGDVRDVSGTSLTLGDLGTSEDTETNTHTLCVQSFSELNKMHHTMVQKGHRDKSLKV